MTAQAGRRRISTIEVKRRTMTSSWLKTLTSDRKEPMSGLLRDGVTSTMVNRARKVSPGRTGFSQRISSEPGEPSDDVSFRNVSQ